MVPFLKIIALEYRPKIVVINILFETVPKSVIRSFGLDFDVIMQIVINETCHPTGKSTFDIILFEDVEVLRIAASFEGEMEDFISQISTVVNVNAETFDTNCK